MNSIPAEANEKYSSEFEQINKEYIISLFTSIESGNLQKYTISIKKSF